MAQQTAFLNSDAPNFNKDFHHTMVQNYLLNNAGVLFSDLVAKPEFTLGDGQISSGSAIVKCTRSSGTFSGEEILATFKSTATEPVDTSGDKKIYIEIAQGFVDNSTTITEVLTGGLNLNVGSIVSAAAYPAHSNYIPLREVSGGDWANATDVRPVIRKFGKRNSIVYFDSNGVEHNIDLDAASINKFLKSNGPGNAPTFENASAGVEVAATKFRFVAGEDIAMGDMFYNDVIATAGNALQDNSIGNTSSNTSRGFSIIGNGVSSPDITLNLRTVGSPADNFVVRIETDSSGVPSGTLADVNATGTLSGGSISGTAANHTISFTGAFTLSDQTPYHIVVLRSGAISSSNYYIIRLEDINTSAYIQHIHNGTAWGADVTTSKIFAELDGMYTGLRCKTDASFPEMSAREGVCTLNTSKGSEFVADTDGVSEVFSSLSMGERYYLSDTPGLISTTPGTINTYIGLALSNSSLLIDFGEDNSASNIGSTGVGVYSNKIGRELQFRRISGAYGITATVAAGGEIELNASGQRTWDAIVDASGNGDYTLVSSALSAGHTRLFVRKGVYNEPNNWVFNGNNGSFEIKGEGKGTVINFDIAGETEYVDCIGASVSVNFSFMTFNVKLGKSSSNHNYFFMLYGTWLGVIEQCNFNVTIDSGSGQQNNLFHGFGGEKSGIRNCEIDVSNSGGDVVTLGTLTYFDSCRITGDYCGTNSSIFNNCYVNLDTIYTAQTKKILGGTEFHITDIDGSGSDRSIGEIANSKIYITSSTNGKPMSISRATNATVEADNSSNIDMAIISFCNMLYLRTGGGALDISGFTKISSSELRTANGALTFGGNGVEISGTYMNTGTGNIEIPNDYCSIAGGNISGAGVVNINGDYTAFSGIGRIASDVEVYGNYNAIVGCTRFSGHVRYNAGADYNTLVGNTSVTIMNAGSGNQIANNT